MGNGNILKEALADSKALKAAAMKNAEKLLLESMKENLKEMVEDQMNEASEDSETSTEEDTLDETQEVATEGLEDLDVAEDDFGDETEEGGEEDSLDDEDLGLSESDLQEALEHALKEVSHGSLGDQEQVLPDKHPTGLLDTDKSEKGWEEKTAPAKKDFTVKEASYQKKIAALVTENTVLKRANNELKKSLKEVHLFNAKLHYAHKLVTKEGLDIDRKRKIVAKFDTVKSVTEAKNLYESLQLAFGSMSGNAKSKKTSLSEALGVDSRGQGKNISETKKPKAEVLTEAVEHNPFDPERMKFLAGIKRK